MNVKDCFSTLPFPTYSCTMRLSDTLPHPPNFHWVSGMCSCWTTTYICFSWAREQSLGPRAGKGAVWVEFPKFHCRKIRWAVGAGLPSLPVERDELLKDRYVTWQSVFCLLPCLHRELKELARTDTSFLRKLSLGGWSPLCAWLAFRTEQAVSNIPTPAQFGLQLYFFCSIT